ncbi:MAG: 4,5-dihydroxyphthalate decarboxylase [Chloroflexi bacterium]|nr:4,5-dihydroxyphthalate decarboxylase [Chloroflexota bacterium]
MLLKGGEPTVVDLTIGISTSPLTQALLQRKVRPEGIRLTCIGAYGKGPASAQIMAGTLDGGEFSLSSLITATARGARLVVLPIFLGRGFVHRGFWGRVGSAVEAPSDYAGKRLAIHRYNNSYGVWARGVLEDEYRVSPRSVHWVGVLDDLDGERPPAAVAIEHVDGGVKRLVELLEEGSVDGAVELYLYKEGPVVRRLFSDFHDVEAASFRRHHIFPIYHTIVLRPEVLEGRPWIAESLMEAFRESRRLASSFMTPEERAEADWQASVLEDDPYAYRLGESEVRSFNRMNQYLVREGLLSCPLEAEAFFARKG